MGEAVRMANALSYSVRGEVRTCERRQVLRSAFENQPPARPAVRLPLEPHFRYVRRLPTPPALKTVAASTQGEYSPAEAIFSKRPLCFHFAKAMPKSRVQARRYGQGNRQ